MGSKVYNFETKRSGETLPYSVDLTDQLPSGVTPSSCVVTATVHKGTDATPSSIVSGSATVSGNVVTQVITGGVDGVIYCLEFATTLSDGNIHESVILLPVSDKC